MTRALRPAGWSLVCMTRVLRRLAWPSMPRSRVCVVSWTWMSASARACWTVRPSSVELARRADLWLILKPLLRSPVTNSVDTLMARSVTDDVWPIS